MFSTWSREVWRLVFVLLVSGAVGFAVGEPALVVGLALLGVVARFLYHLRHLQHWLEDPERSGLATEYGVWGDIYAGVRRIQSGQRARERRLSEDLREFQASAAAMPDALVSLGPRWDIRWMNQAATELLGLRSLEDRGQPFINLYRSPELAQYLQRGKFEQPLEINARGRSSRRLSIRVIPYAEKQRLLVAQDVTSRYRLERVRTDFVANASHELRTPLTVISGFVENLQDEGSDCAMKWARPLKLMAQQTQRMQRIVEDLLLLARLEGAGSTEQERTVNVAQICTELHDVAGSARAERPQVRVEAEAGLALRGDEQELRSAFQNLVVNAITYTPPEGEVTIRWQPQADGGACFEVVDTGEGIAAEHIPRLTERFYRVDTGRSRQQGGTGLGLAIVKHVLAHHEARLEITSELGKGSRFACHFPPKRVERVAAPVRVVEKVS